MTNPEKNWVWWSDKESRKTGKTSILAIAETIVAVAFYWWLAFQIDTAFMLIVSPIVAFLVLLRSDGSIKKGVRLFDSYLNLVEPSTRAKVLIGLVSFCIAGASTFVLANSILIDQSDWSLFWRASFMSLLAIFLGATVAVTVQLAREGAGVGAVAGAAAGIAAVGVVGAVALAGQLAGAAVVAVVVAATATRQVATVGVAAIIVLAVAFRVFLIRCWATISFFPDGLRHFSQNWVHLMWREDLKTPPSLIPGLPDEHHLQFSIYFSSKVGNEIGYIPRGFVAVFLYLPGIVYRFTLKSTAWLYVPVIWMAHIPQTLREKDKKEVWVKTAGRGWFTLISALSALAYALYLAFDPNEFRAIQTANENQMFTPWHLVWAIDPAGWKLWFWITIPSALLTILLWGWVRKISANLAAGGQLEWHSSQMRWLIFFNQVKTALIITWLIMTFLSVARAGWLLEKLPVWMEPIFTNFVLPVTGFWSS